jgi:hypothetical protein
MKATEDHTVGRMARVFFSAACVSADFLYLTASRVWAGRLEMPNAITTAREHKRCALRFLDLNIFTSIGAVD